MLQTVFNGILQGLSLAVLGVAFGTVAATSRIFYVALGALYAASPYVFAALRQWSQPWPAALLETILIIAALSLLCEEWIHWPLNRSHSPDEVHFISSLGAYVAIEQALALAWGNDPRFLEGTGVVVRSMGSLRITGGQLVGAIAAVLCLLLLLVWLRFSEAGITWRALADNSDLLSVLGRNVRTIRRAVFAVSGALVCVVSLASALDVGYDPRVGMPAVIAGLAVAIIGGRGAFGWIAVAGCALGILRATVAWFLTSRWQEAATMLLMVLALLFFPRGLRALTDSQRRLEDTL